jgi:hypothetical protein
VNSDSERYAPDHLARVALDIFMPGCEMAGYNAARANQIRDANLIHLDILQKLVDARLIAAVVVKPGHASVPTTDKFRHHTKPHSRRRWNPWRRAGKPVSPLQRWLQRRGLGVATRLP